MGLRVDSLTIHDCILIFSIESNRLGKHSALQIYNFNCLLCNLQFNSNSSHIWQAFAKWNAKFRRLSLFWKADNEKWMQPINHHKIGFRIIWANMFTIDKICKILKFYRINLKYFIPIFNVIYNSDVVEWIGDYSNCPVLATNATL